MTHRKSASEVFGDTALGGAEASGAVLGRPWSASEDVEQDSRSQEASPAPAEQTRSLDTASSATMPARAQARRSDPVELQPHATAQSFQAPMESESQAAMEPEVPARPFVPPAAAPATRRRPAKSTATEPARRPNATSAKKPPQSETPARPPAKKPAKRPAKKAIRQPRSPGRPRSEVQCLPRREVRIPEVVFQRQEAVSEQTGLPPMEALWMLAHLGWRQWNQDESASDQERRFAERVGSAPGSPGGDAAYDL